MTGAVSITCHVERTEAATQRTHSGEATAKVVIQATSLTSRAGFPACGGEEQAGMPARRDRQGCLCYVVVAPKSRPVVVKPQHDKRTSAARAGSEVAVTLH